MNRVVIVGAGDFGRELASWLEDDQVFVGSDVIVHVDDDLEAFATHPRLIAKLIGSIRDFTPIPGDRVLMGISDPSVKRSLHRTMTQHGVEFESFIHRSVIVASSARVGTGAVICPNAVISCDAQVGDFVTVNVAASIGHDAYIGNFASLMSHVDVTGWASIGEACFLGSHASVLPHVEVQSEAVVGAGSVVIRRVPTGTTVIGVPAKRL